MRFSLKDPNATDEERLSGLAVWLSSNGLFSGLEVKPSETNGDINWEIRGIDPSPEDVRERMGLEDFVLRKMRWNSVTSTTALKYRFYPQGTCKTDTSFFPDDGRKTPRILEWWDMAKYVECDEGTLAPYRDLPTRTWENLRKTLPTDSPWDFVKTVHPMACREGWRKKSVENLLAMKTGRPWDVDPLWKNIWELWEHADTWEEGMLRADVLGMWSLKEKLESGEIERL